MWADYAKGLAIVCVVFSHVLRGLWSAKIFDPTPAWEFIDCWLFTFQVPLFFFISGAYVKRAEAKIAPREFVRDSLLRLGYPYVVWQTLQILIMLAASGATNSSVQWIDLLLFPVEPMFQFWFLYVLLLILVVYAGLRRLNLSDHIICLLFASMLLWPDVGWPPLREMSAHAIFFAYGLAAPGLLKWMSNWSIPYLVLCSTACLAAMTLMVSAGVAYPTPGHPLAALFGILGTVAGAMVLDKCLAVPGLGFLGRYSLEIYAAHVCLTAAVRIVLSRVFHIQNVPVHIVLAIIAGLLGPCVIGLLAKRYKIPVFRPRPWKFASFRTDDEKTSVAETKAGRELGPRSKIAATALSAHD
jgi:fucose 4-O-acetylase-like acetyltransferase